MIDLRSGFFKIRSRKYPILWTGLYAEHVANEHFLNPNTHPILHLTIQKFVQTAKNVKIEKPGTYICTVDYNIEFELHIPVMIQSQFAIIKTCYKMKKKTEHKAVKGIKTKRKAAPKEEIWYRMDDEGWELTKPHIGPNTTRESFDRWRNKHLYGIKKMPDWVKY